MPRKKRPRSIRGSLLIVAGFLIASAVVRIGSEAGQVFAKETPFGQETLSTAEPEQICEPPPDLRAMMVVFKEREDRIETREREIIDRARALEITGEEVELRLQELAAAENELRALITIAETAAEDDLSRLTNVYESMKPKEAAALFEQMDPEFAAGFLGRMSPEAAAGVMAGLPPQVAYTVSVVLAGRNANAPKE